MSPRVLRFDVEFLTRYAVAQTAVIPGSALKGMMLDAARDLGLGGRYWPLLRAVFGGHKEDVAGAKENDYEGGTSLTEGPTVPSPWSWSDMAWSGGKGPARERRSRIRINPDTGTADDGALVAVNEFLIRKGTFAISQIGPIPDPLDTLELEAEAHVTVLEAAARTMTALGADRRRGLGWVAVTRAGKPTTPEQLAEALDGLQTQDKVQS
ncbi:MAG: hypothetical protein LBJ08_11580, partial [Bifidobacteriaceae bacterium]|nr:hypothetical protein [Bifidobacteriaceae bacterium]